MENELHSLVLPHVRLGEEDGRVVVLVEDDELFDFVDDYLTETCDLACESYRLSDSVQPTNTLIFPAGIVRRTVEDALRKLDPLELERIFRINNPIGAEE